MYSALAQYLIQYKKLGVPGIGTFFIKREAAVIDFPAKLINAPVYTVSLQPDSITPSGSFFDWLASALKISDTEAIRRFNDFSLNLKNNLNDRKEIKWDGIGKIYKTGAGNIALEPVRIQTGNSLAANRVLREKAEHMVRVGEDERSSVQMEALLMHEEVKRSYWWAWALAVALVSLMFIGWYFSEHGLDPSSSANIRKAEIQTSAETYK